MFDPVAYINEPRWHTMSLGLDRIKDLLARLGNPHDSLRFVHVAGTNGKGSTCAFIERIVREAGYKVGLFTSPYIMCFEERIRLNGINIPMDDLRRVTEQVRSAAEAMDDHPTEFELMTAVAFLYFAQQQCDIVVAEVGLGGRLDSTNVISTVEVSVLTPVSFDHQALLGDSLSDIATEKAGIIKQGVPVVSAPQAPETISVFRRTAHERSTSIIWVDSQSIRGTSDAYSYASWHDLKLGLRGSYQYGNAATALEACSVLRQRGWNISDEAIRVGLACTSWPGRFELVRRNPDVVIDGAHNIQAAEVLAQELRQSFSGRRIVFVLGVLQDKDYSDMLDVLLPLAHAVACITPPNPRALSAAHLACLIQEKQSSREMPLSDVFHASGELESEASKKGIIPVIGASSILQALEWAFEQAGADGVVCACGSLYSIGDIKRALEQLS